ncbi:MAG: hypothetical protein CM15mP25_3660 [Gammaproteobacteria bacterium]|nr:MAG: hypothetical protein CM15mP25_3660 [Gammaproteobacteria bacterium]
MIPGRCKGGHASGNEPRKQSWSSRKGTAAGARMAVSICIVVSQSNFHGARFSDRALYAALAAGIYAAARRRGATKSPCMLDFRLVFWSPCHGDSAQVRGFLCTTTHPTGVLKRAAAGRACSQQGLIADGPKRMLVLSASTGYGLASRITRLLVLAHRPSAFSSRSRTERKPGTAGWYNSAGFHQLADEAGPLRQELKRRCVLG